ncbi:protein of unknown function [Streptomyces sp. 2224.1]|uniref:DUF397 domain-containing protein n=1 Tax=unclassified Streptomyces TaxID=2593676 RepID=UPI00087EA61B|nr:MULTISPECIES: DUF397 domain-containing protein [unclassified Streptomyces]PBC82917.1 uncharacterized protein DUF397 [Streptomyces sp. 2321.6]SDR46290.1 protein of unknown function [Streptomyces sp. KS_16]SEC27849.1 protein of unknown function [Streptomyces sp. 2224.1]SEC76757.1 protein of unknown function [Streptomyces sp. 2133.1]SEE89863.1 protein of unknown function [Streptomyces sp. 2112.3]
MNTPPTVAQLATAGWFKSSYSAANNECVEVAHARAWVAVRDSKAPDGPTLAFPAAAFTAFVDEVRRNGAPELTHD